MLHCGPTPTSTINHYCLTIKEIHNRDIIQVEYCSLLHLVSVPFILLRTMVPNQVENSFLHTSLLNFFQILTGKPIKLMVPQATVISIVVQKVSYPLHYA